MKSSVDGFYNLDPSAVMRATELAGFSPTGEFQQLNSYENRVFNICLESGQNMDRIIAKFYRPQRWSKECILEEHSFMNELQNEDIPAIAPLVLQNKQTLIEFDGLWVAFFPRCQGRMPDELLQPDFATVGRTMARVHNLGAQKKFKYRPILGQGVLSVGEALEVLMEYVRPELWPRYEEAAIQLHESLDLYLETTPFLRIHGDAHRGNLLYRDEFFLVDFDDCMMGPASQDFWMLLKGAPEEDVEFFVDGYSELREFPFEEWKQASLLQGLRIILYSAWIARRWSDPSFPRLFPLFESYQFWAEETEALERIVRS